MTDALLNPVGVIVKKRDEPSQFYLHSSSANDAKVKKLKQLLLSWMNSYLREDKLFVRDLAEDLHDGQLLIVFLEKLTGQKVDDSSVVGAQAERSKKYNLQRVVKFLYEKLGVQTEEGIVQGIFEKDFVSIARLLVLLAHEFKCPYRLPSNVEVVIVHKLKLDSTMGQSNKTSRHVITGDESAYGMTEAELTVGVQTMGVDGLPHRILPAQEQEKDAFDELFESGDTSKQETVKKLLTSFVNKHLNLIGVHVSNLTNQFHDGVYLVMLIGSLGNFFVPAYSYHMAPTSTDMKIHNIKFAFKLMAMLEVKIGNWPPEEIVRQDPKTIMRVLYSLFTAFKNTSAT